MESSELLTLEDAPRRLGLKHAAVRRAIARGQLPAMQVCSRIRIDPAERRNDSSNGQTPVGSDPRAVLAYPRRA
jgi:hypothetical protein